MWKAAFSGRSESGSLSGSKRKKSNGRADSIASSPAKSRGGGDEEDRERRRSSLHRSSRSAYGDGDNGGGSVYASAPSSRTGPLTESAVRALNNPDDDEGEWEDEERDRRSERKSRRGDSRDGERRRKSRSEKERSRSRERSDRKERRRGESDKTRGKARVVVDRDGGEGTRAIPAMGSFEQFPGQYAGAVLGGPTNAEHTMSGALPAPDPAHQFPGQNPASFDRPPPEIGLNRADSFGAAADYYLDEGQSVQYQPGVRPLTPNMLVNPDNHLMPASAVPQPAQDTGHGSAADFYSGRVSPVYTAEPPAKPTTSSGAKPYEPGKQSLGSSKLSRLSSAAGAVAAAATVGALALNHHQSSSTSSYPQGSATNPSKPALKPLRQNSEPLIGVGRPSYPGTSSPRLPPSAPGSGTPGKYPSQTNSHVPLLAAGAAAAAAAGYAAYEMEQHHDQQSRPPSYYGGGGGHGPPPRPPFGPGNGSYMNGGGAGQGPPPPRPPFTPGGGGSYMNGGGMAQSYHFHEHKGPITRLKDGLFNLISSPEDVRQMEEYTEYIGVCKYCFDPRSSPYDAPRMHHFHKRRDSFEDLRRRRSAERLYRKPSADSLHRTGSTRVDKESRYYSSADRDKRKGGGKADLLAAGLAGAGVAAGANMLFNDRKDFDDTYSVKSGHRASSAVRRRSRSSSRERRRRSSYGVVGPQKEEWVTVRTKDGKVERRRVLQQSRSRSRSKDQRSGFTRLATGAALGAAAASIMAGGSSHDRRESPSRAAWVREHSRSRSRNHSPLNGRFYGYSDSKSRSSDGRSPNRSYYNGSQHGQRAEGSPSFFGGFFSPSANERKERRPSREHRKKRRGFFNFSNASSSSSDADMAFGEGFLSKTNLPLMGKASKPRVRRRSDDHLAATVAGIGATAAALAAAQKSHRIGKRTSRSDFGGRRPINLKTREAEAKINVATRQPDDEDWEDELPSDVDDASSTNSALAFGESTLSNRQSMESISSGDGLMSTWGWRWGGKDNKRRKPSSSPTSYDQRLGGSFTGPLGAGLAAGAVAGVALDAAGRPLERIGTTTSAAGGPPPPPMQHIDPRPMFDANSRHGSMAGGFEPSPIRPGPGPIQHPRPVAPITPAFVQSPTGLDERPKLRRSASSPTRSSFGLGDAALIGAGAIAAGSIIASQNRKPKEPGNVRFGLTEEQRQKEDRDRRREQDRADEERRRADRTRALKEEAERTAKETDARQREEEVRRRREEENRRAAEVALASQRAADQNRAEIERQRLESERREKEYRQEQLRLQEEARRQEENRRQWEVMAAQEAAQNEARERAEQDRQARTRREAELEAEIEMRRRELVEQDRVSREQKDQGSSEFERKRSEATRKSSTNWGAVAAGAAAAATAGAVLAGAEDQSHRDKDDERVREHDQYPDGQALHHPVADDGPTPSSYASKQIEPSEKSSGSPLMDDDLFDRDFFKRKRSDSEYTRHAELARKAAEKVIADMDEYYAKPAPSQADFFRPAVLSDPAQGKTRVADVHGDNEVQVYHAAQEDIQSHFPSQYTRYGVPALNVIAPTPPPEMVNADMRKTSRSSTPLSQATGVAVSESQQSEENSASGKRDRTRSISWGEDKTHIYDPPTPEPFQEHDSYMNAKDVAIGAAVAGVAAAGVALDEKFSDKKGDGMTRGEEETQAQSKLDRGTTSNETSGVDVYDTEAARHITTSPSRQPLHDLVSNVMFGPMDSPETEGAPPVRGWVEEEEVTDPTPVEEKTPHIPGEFDADEIPVSSEQLIQKPDEELELVESYRDAKEEPVWDLPLSKKEKKKREKAAKRAASLDEAWENETASAPTDVDRTLDQPGEENTADYFPSKKDKKKRDKAFKRGVSDASSPTDPGIENKRPEMEEESPAQEASPSEADMPQLSKKEQRKRDKEARKQGFADVAEAVMTAGGIAAVAAGAEDIEENWSSPSGKKGKKGKKKAKEPERDIRDIEPIVSESAADKYGPTMPGGWEASASDSTPEMVSEVPDPFQYQIKNDDELPPSSDAKDADPFAEFAEVKKGKKSKKRDSGRFNEPAASSPLRSEWNYDDYVGEKPAVNGKKEEKLPEIVPAVANLTSRETGEEERPTEASEAKSYENGRITDAPRSESPQDGRSRSVASEPTPGRDERRSSKGGKARSEIGYADDPDYYEDRSIAASEPVDYYESRAAKRRSKREDDDAVSVTSSRSRREKDEPASSKKEKKGGLFGLFSRKSSDAATLSRASTRSDEAALSRTSTRDSREGEDEGGERKHRHRRHREGSLYGDDDDDTRSVKSESRHHHHREYENGYRDDDEKDSRRSSRYGDDDFGTRSESGRRHHHRHRSGDDVDSASRRDSDGEHRHHHRRRTDEGAYDDKNQSFLGMRVEDLPPLPASPPESPALAPAEKEEQDVGSPASAKADSEAPGLEREIVPAAILGAVAAKSLDHEQTRTRATENLKAPQDVPNQHEEDLESLPALPTSRPGSPTQLETPHRPPLAFPRAASSSAVPVRLTFGQHNLPLAKERPVSFIGSSPSTPASPLSAQQQKKARPSSNEFRPLYLVECNRKTPEVDDGELLPSLPSSKPSSRASSIHGGGSDDAWHSATEDFPSPSHGRGRRRHGLSLDTEHANLYDNQAELKGEDYLDSQQTTPKASDFAPPHPDGTPQITTTTTARQEPQFYTWADLERDAHRHARQEPQFYTWEDFERDERLHDFNEKDVAAVPHAELERGEVPSRLPASRSPVHGDDQELPALPSSRPNSPYEDDHNETARHKLSAKGIAALAMLGSAAVFAHRSHERSRSPDKPNVESHQRALEQAGPLPAPVEDVKPLEDVREALPEQPPLSRKASGKKKKKGKKGKLVEAEEVFTSSGDVSVEESTIGTLRAATTDELLRSEAQVEECGRTVDPEHATAINKVMPLEELQNVPPEPVDTAELIASEDQAEAGARPDLSISSEEQKGQANDVGRRQVAGQVHSSGNHEMRDAVEDINRQPSEVDIWKDAEQQSSSIGPASEFDRLGSVEHLVNVERHLEANDQDGVEPESIQHAVQIPEEQSQGLSSPVKKDVAIVATEQPKLTRKQSKKTKKKQRGVSFADLEDTTAVGEVVEESSASVREPQREDFSMDMAEEGKDTQDNFAQAIAIPSNAADTLDMRTENFVGGPNIFGDEPSAARDTHSEWPAGIETNQPLDILEPQTEFEERDPLSIVSGKKNKKQKKARRKQQAEQWYDTDEQSTAVKEDERMEVADLSNRSDELETGCLRPEDVPLPAAEDSELHVSPEEHGFSAEIVPAVAGAAAVWEMENREDPKQNIPQDDVPSQLTLEDTSTVARSEEQSTSGVETDEIHAEKSLPNEAYESPSFPGKESITAQQATELEEFSWQPTSKKSKKGKKGKKSGQATPTLFEEPTAISNLGEQEVSEASYQSPAGEIESSEPAKPDDSGAFWNTTSKKKGKKSKRTQTWAGIEGPADEAAITSAIPIAEASTECRDLAEPTMVPQVDEDPNLSVANCEIPTELASVNTGDVEPEGDWTGFSTSSKKKKKGKKSEKANTAPASDTVEFSADTLAEQPDPAASEDKDWRRDVQPEDVWSGEQAGKRGKKGKKGKKTKQGLDWTEPEEPRVLEESPMVQNAAPEASDRAEDTTGVMSSRSENNESSPRLRVFSLLPEVEDLPPLPESPLQASLVGNEPDPMAYSSEGLGPDESTSGYGSENKEIGPIECPVTATPEAEISGSIIEDSAPKASGNVSCHPDEEEQMRLDEPTTEDLHWPNIVDGRGDEMPLEETLLESSKEDFPGGNEHAVVPSEEKQQSSVEEPTPFSMTASNKGKKKSKKARRAFEDAWEETPREKIDVNQEAAAANGATEDLTRMAEIAEAAAGTGFVLDKADEDWKGTSTKSSKKEKRKSKKGCAEAPVDALVSTTTEAVGGFVDDLRDVRPKEADPESRLISESPVADEQPTSWHAEEPESHVENSQSPLSAEVPSEELWRSNSTKSSKRDKRKARKLGLIPVLDDINQGEAVVEGEEAMCEAATPGDTIAGNTTPARSIEASKIATPAIDETTVPDVPLEDNVSFGAFSRKLSKKEKRRAKKGDGITESAEQDDVGLDPEQFGSDNADSTQDFEQAQLPAKFESEDQKMTISGMEGPILPVLEGNRETASTPSGHVPSAEQVETPEGLPLRKEQTPEAETSRASQDIEFAATVAAGLADSGFDPNLVVNDASFYRRSSPPATLAEADPEEVFSFTTKRKGKKAKRAKQLAEDAIEEPKTAVVSNEPPETPTTAQDGDHFESAVTEGLKGAGFDPSLLQQMVSSSDATTPQNEVADDEPSFTFSTTKKKKKGKKGKALAETREDYNASVPLATTVIENLSQEAEFTSQSRDLPENAQSDAPYEDAESPQHSTQAYEAEPDSPNNDIDNTIPDPGPAVEDPADGSVVVGDRNTDVDEMDQAFRANKRKEKRKKKKLRGSIAEHGDGLETSQDSEPTGETPAEPNAQGEKSVMDHSMNPTSPTSSTSKVQSVFPGLQRVKFRRPSSTSTGSVHGQDQSASMRPEFSGAPRSETSIVEQPSPGAEMRDGNHEEQRPKDRGWSEIGLAAAGAGAAALGLNTALNGFENREDRSAIKDGAEPTWSFATLDNGQPPIQSPVICDEDHAIARDSGYQEVSSPRDSTQCDSTGVRPVGSRESLHSRRSAEPLHIDTSAGSEWNLNIVKSRDPQDAAATSLPHVRTPSLEITDTPLESTTKTRASYLFQTTPENLRDFPQNGSSDRSRSSGTEYFIDAAASVAFDGTPSRSGRRSPPTDRPVLSPPPAGPLSPRMQLHTIPEEHFAVKRNKALNDVGGPDAIKAMRRTETPPAIRSSKEENAQPSVIIPPPDERLTSNPMSTDQVMQRPPHLPADEVNETVNIDRAMQQSSIRTISGPRSPSVLSNRSGTSVNQHIRSPDELRSFSRISNRSSTPTLRRIDRSMSGDLRAASRRDDTGSGSGVGARASPKTIPFEPPPTPPPNDEDLIAGAAGAAVMADVFVRYHASRCNIVQADQGSQSGYGDAQASQTSPTRPPSVRKRQSMHIVELETRLDQLAAENRALQDAKVEAQRGYGLRNGDNTQDALVARDRQLQEKDFEINQIKALLEPMQEELDRLREINNGLTEANRNLVDDMNGRYATLQQEHAHAHGQWQSASRDLENLRQEHGQVMDGMKDAIEAEIATALADKNAEILRLREELDIANEQIRALQVQVQSSRANDFLTIRDEDYFDGACQKLCQHVQQWVLRFSKLSDNRICRLSMDIKDDKLEARLDNAILDGSDVDKLLSDRVRRRDVFMSVVMTMVWEYVFTRYLFGMDREQRQKLKALEKTLADVGPPRAVAQWRATTLTLLSKRPEFASQCTLDTEAVAHEIFSMLCAILPPPTNTEAQLLASLQKVVGLAAELSIEMRTQRAEYIMLPPLQPEYDTHGDLVRQVHFNASLMNERSGLFQSNEALERERAVVKMVLFPLVVKKGDEGGEGEEEIVVCPAQVLVQHETGRGKKFVRVMSGAMEIDDPSVGMGRTSRGSLVSNAPTGSGAF